MVNLMSLLRTGLARRARLAAGGGRDLGASALEWAIIAAISVVIVTVVGGVIYKVVDAQNTKISDCGTVAAAPGATC